MNISIFIKSWPKDYEFLGYCLRSIQKYVTGYSEIVVVLPTGRALPLTKERVVFVDDWKIETKPGAPSAQYYMQMHEKLIADIHCPTADYIFYVDSDCVFTRAFDLSEMFSDGKPMLLRRDWKDAGGGIIWKEPAEEALCFPATHDTMACHPSIYRVHDLRNLREHIKKTHRVSLEAYIKRCDRFIEFVTLGNFCLKFAADQYKIVDMEANDIYPRPLIQNWSWGGINKSSREVLEGIVS